MRRRLPAHPQEITAEDIAKLTARPSPAEGEAEGGESEGEGSTSGGSSSGGADAESQRQQQPEQQQGGQGPAATEGSDAGQQNGSEQGSAPPAVAARSASEPSGSAAAVEGDSGDEAEAARGGQGDADDAAEVAALLREENLEALADEEREKLTQASGGKEALLGQPKLGLRGGPGPACCRMDARGWRGRHAAVPPVTRAAPLLPSRHTLSRIIDWLVLLSSPGPAPCSWTS